MYCVIFFRVYVENIDQNVRKLYITRIEDGDAGIYGCKAVIKNEERWKNLTLDLFSKYNYILAGAPDTVRDKKCSH